MFAFGFAALVVLLAGWGAWATLGITSQRIDKITHDVAAISDGRSLHRRLSMENAGEEFEQLVATLNAMIERLETSFLGLRRFTADASHELKTPLAVLRADVERAMSEASTQSERMVALEEALHETTRMADLVESLLTLARADEGRFDIHREPVELKPLVDDVYETALILGEGAGVAVNLQFTAEVTVMGDPTRLRQLFLNLVTNAIKYTPAGGKVDIGLGLHPDNVTFAVRDTGIGIAAADVPYIFERFWRADRVRSRMSERGGFGLGLSISQWIAQAHGGTLTASSRLGRGSLFTVTLPLPQAQTA
jgi:signal transduction histidine kinase